MEEKGTKKKKNREHGTIKEDSKMDCSVFLKGRLVLNRLVHVRDSYSHSKLMVERKASETIRKEAAEKPFEQAWFN